MSSQKVKPKINLIEENKIIFNKKHSESSKILSDENHTLVNLNKIFNDKSTSSFNLIVRSIEFNLIK